MTIHQTLEAISVPDHPTRDDIDLLSGDFWGSNPHEQFTWMRANAPVYWDGHAWGIARHADLKAISKDPATFCNGKGIRPDADPMQMMIDMDDPDHHRRRKLVNKGFTPRRVREREEEIRLACTQIIDAVCERGECDFVTDIAAWLPLVIIGNDLGIAPKDRATLLEWSDAMLSALTGDPASLEPATLAFIGYAEYANEVIDQRKGVPGKDLMSVLIHAEVDGDRLRRQELIDESLLLLIGGDETTRHVISGGAYQLLRNGRSEWDRLVANPTLLTQGIEEMLRWVTPIKNMNRTATRDIEFGGQLIKEGDNVMLLYPSANRDEDVFTDPFRFDISRAPNDHVAFGFGTHFCLGNSLARLELRVMFEELLRRLPDIELVSEEEPAYRAANFVSGYESMPVRFTPTAPEGEDTLVVS
ncbi:MAG: cytochrome P450 [Acidimicrobiales bacterium]|nr:cytochrome P450 [Acidimicrobiales bacterium]